MWVLRGVLIPNLVMLILAIGEAELGWGGSVPMETNHACVLDHVLD